MGKVSKLDNVDFAKAVAEAYISGISRPEMADMFEVHKDTITIWTRDPRVQAHAGRLALERVNRITRRIDGEMEARLSHVDQWELDELLKVRKEYLDRSLKIDLNGAGSTAETTNEILEAMDESPEFAEKLLALAAGRKSSAE